MGRIVISGEEAKEKLVEGVNALADIVKLTMGPAGRNVLLNDVMKQRITKDGVSVAKEIKFDDPVMEAGARLVKEAAQKTCDDSGDSTTLCTLLTQVIVNRGMEILKEGSIRPIELKRMMDENCKKVVEQLNKMAVPCEDDERLMQVAMVSSNGDEKVAELVCKALKQATKDGAVGVETSPTNYSYVDTVMGMRFERGFESEYFQNNDNMKNCVFESPNIVLYRGKLDNINEFVKILEPSINIGRPLVIMADEYSLDVINALAINKVQNGFRLCAIRLPAFKEQRDAMVEDLEILLGCKAVNTPSCPIDEFSTYENLGSCDKITIDKHYTTITGGDGDPEALRTRIEAIREEIEHSTDDNTIARLRERLVKLSGGVSIIYIGSDSETETNEIKDRVDDAICAVRSAMQEGVVPGGGIALHTIAIDMSQSKDSIEKMLSDVLEAPFLQLLTNAGYNEAFTQNSSNSIGMLNHHKPVTELIGIDITSDFFLGGFSFQPCNMLDSGIIDPKKSIRVALENAVSVAGMLLSTEACVVEDPR